MGLTRICLKNPAAAGVVLAIITLLGVLSVTRLPVQLFPSIERPQISVFTSWRAASPREIESEITEPIERELRGIPGMIKMQSWSNQGSVWMNLEFALGTDMGRHGIWTAFLVSSAVNTLGTGARVASGRWARRPQVAGKLAA